MGSVGSWVVEGAPMVIPFQKVFLRQPREGEGEGDVVLDEEFLVIFARAAWRAETSRHPPPRTMIRGSRQALFCFILTSCVSCFSLDRMDMPVININDI